WSHGRGPASGQVAGTTAPSGAGSFGILVLGSLVERPADPVAEGVGGLAGERRVQVAQGGAREEVLLARFPARGGCPEGPRRWTLSLCRVISGTERGRMPTGRARVARASPAAPSPGPARRCR